MLPMFMPLNFAAPAPSPLCFDPLLPPSAVSLGNLKRPSILAFSAAFRFSSAFLRAIFSASHRHSGSFSSTSSAPSIFLLFSAGSQPQEDEDDPPALSICARAASDMTKFSVAAWFSARAAGRRCSW